jgi:hypothetical protein
MRRRAVALGVAIALIAAISLAVGGSGGGSHAGARGGVLFTRSLRAPWNADPHGPGALAPGSDPRVLPGPVLIADRDNNRLLIVDPRGRVVWRFPAATDLAAGQSFNVPDDAFFSPDATKVIATQEDDSVISVIDLARRRIVYRYGHAGIPGSGPGYLHNPDDALLMASGEILSADIKNCRLIVIRPPAHVIARQFGITESCEHQPGVSYGSPNGAFPMSNGDTAVTEINGDWLDVIGRGGRVISSINPPGLSYPSDTNEVRPGLFLSADYTSPGTIETFTGDGRLRWRYAPTGPDALNQPSLALPLPNGDILANDDKNHRVIVIDPRTNKVVWQYGHTHVPGSGDGYLSNPDGVDLAPPYSLASRFAKTMKAP